MCEKADSDSVPRAGVWIKRAFILPILNTDEEKMIFDARSEAQRNKGK